MIGRRWVQGGGIAGITAFVVITITFMVGGTMPSSSASTAKIADYVVNHRTAVLAQTALTVIAAALIMWFVATFARLLHARDEHSPLGMLVLAAGVGMAVVMTLEGLTLTSLAFLSKQGGLTDASVIRAFYELENGIVMPGAFGWFAAILLASTGAAIVRRMFAAPWLGWLSLALAPLAAAGSVVGLTATAGGTSLLGFLPAISSGVILLMASVFMLREHAAGDGALAPAGLAAAATS